ncbi:MAG TPA: hypothetical protein VGP32_09955, partial [Steroidobacteraceae bacterium]|nr:hypothetical protein [Steroidobacteraceae bacterium]
MKRLPLIVISCIAGLAPLVAQGRPLTPEDWFRFQAVSDLEIAPDGGAVATSSPATTRRPTRAAA